MSKTGKINTSEFWERVDYLRNKKDMTLAELQKEIGKTGTYLYVVRSHVALPSIDVIMKIADVLEVSTDMLLGHVVSPIAVEDEELREIVRRWQTDPQFKAIVKSIVSQL